MISAEKFCEWAFGHERAELEPSRDRDTGKSAFGMGYRSNFDAFVEISLLGCRVDKSVRGATYLADFSGHVHWDAETAAAVLNGLSEAGTISRNDVYLLLEHARTGTRPSWMEGVTPRVVPRPHPEKPQDQESGWVDTREGRRGRTELTPATEARKWGSAPGCANDRERPSVIRYFEAGRWKKLESRICPITFTPTPQQIAAHRETYQRWWTALHTFREYLIEGNVLKSHTLSREFPPPFPWVAKGEGPTIFETGQRPDWRK